jgi:hypothetical protein
VVSGKNDFAILRVRVCLSSVGSGMFQELLEIAKFQDQNVPGALGH